MRRGGLALEDGAGSTLVFGEGPAQWVDATQTVFHFDDLKLSRMEFTYENLSTADVLCSTYKKLWERLQSELGYPWDQTQSLEESCVNGQPAKHLEASFTDFSTRGVLRIEGNRARVVLGPDGAPGKFGAVQEKVEAEEDTSQYAAYAIAARFAAESLLDEFGDQPFVSKAAKRRRRPVFVRLQGIKIAKSLQSVDKMLIERRVRNIIRGEWDLDLTRSARRAELEMKVAIVPALRDGERIYAMTLEVRDAKAKGKNKKKVLFSGARVLDTNVLSNI
jgi:hypothetical protein